MSNSHQLPPETLAWLQQSASIHGSAYSQVILHILARLEYLEATQHAHIDIPLDDLAGIAELGVIEANARDPGLLTAAEAHQIALTETMEKVKNAQKLINEGGTLAEALEMMGLATPKSPSSPAPLGKLVDRVALALGDSTSTSPELGRRYRNARAAIHEVVVWLDDKGILAGDSAKWLRKEIGQ